MGLFYLSIRKYSRFLIDLSAAKAAAKGVSQAY